MGPSAKILFNAFLRGSPSGKRETLLASLSRGERQSLGSLPPTFQDPTEGLCTTEQLLDKIDLSWIGGYLKNLPEGEASLFVSSLEESRYRELKKFLPLPSPLPTVTPLGKKYLHHRLFEKLKGEQPELLPIECLPESPLNLLLELDLEKYAKLIRFLGLHDVAFDLRHIIESAKIKRVESCLNSEERRYLKTLLQQKELIAFKRIYLDRWDGDPATLNEWIHQRGLNRIGKALFGQNESLLWYLAHRLDREEATHLNQLCSDLKKPQITALLIRQLVDLVALLNHPPS
jgi:hypothetical protein